MIIEVLQHDIELILIDAGSHFLNNFTIKLIFTKANHFIFLKSLLHMFHQIQKHHGALFVNIIEIHEFIDTNCDHFNTFISDTEQLFPYIHLGGIRNSNTIFLRYFFMYFIDLKLSLILDHAICLLPVVIG